MRKTLALLGVILLFSWPSQAKWWVTSGAGTAGSGTGDVTGPGSATADTLPIYQDGTGKVLKGGGPSYTSGVLATPASAAGGTFTATESSAFSSTHNVKYGVAAGTNLSTSYDCRVDILGAMPASCLADGYLSIENTPTLGHDMNADGHAISGASDISADSFSTTISTSVGQSLILHEDSTHGSAKFGFKVPDAGLTGNTDYTCSVTAAGLIPTACTVAKGDVVNTGTPVTGDVPRYLSTSGTSVGPSELNMVASISEFKSATDRYVLRLFEDTDLGANYLAVAPFPTATTLSSSVTVNLTAMGRASTAAATSKRGPVIGGLSNGGVQDTPTEMCTQAYTGGSGVTTACLEGSAKSYDPTTFVITKLACADTVASGTYYEVVCTVW